ncbi:hypothetical protein [Corynebacterium diphtheriae]|uniref:hypothetical protein n=1 Tax=Corynebacterium diphtheriae TaxID=1717 RepID=UPI0012430162|nr:hypothetical protein [Corynebacterium diphtheriae]CAB0618962.1 hypothetical protein CIP107536_02086 [Corynebacterium diphtheriae]VVH30712.1 hypothetical protein NCPHL90_02157 [Corynebacterium diphtheriae]
MVKNWILSIILNLFFWLLALMLITVYDDYLTELVPVHFGRGGRPDAWEVRTSLNVYRWAILSIFSISLGIFSVLQLSAWARTRKPKLKFVEFLGFAVFRFSLIYSYLFCLMFISVSFENLFFMIPLLVITIAFVSIFSIPTVLSIALIMSDRK